MRSRKRSQRSRGQRNGRANDTSQVFRTVQHVRLIQSTWTGTDIFSAFSFQLSDLPNYLALSAVWDEYQLWKVVLRFYPILEVSNSTTIAATANIVTPPSLLVANDFTDVTTPTENILLEHEDLVFKGPMTHLMTHVVNPSPLMAAYQGTFTGYARTTPHPWVETNSSGVEHYGTKYGITKGQNTPAISCAYQIYASYHLRFRRVVG